MQRFKVKEYIDVLRENNQLVDVVSCENILEKEVINVSYSSNNIKKDTLFVCKGFGNNFKREYLEEAITKGAFVVPKIDKEDTCQFAEDFAELYEQEQEEKSSYETVCGMR